MKMICVFGHFGKGELLLNGQTIKTNIITDELEKRYSINEVVRKDTSGRIFALIKIPFQVLGSLMKCENIIMLPAYKGVRVLTPLLLFFNHLFRRRLHYIVIGGWLPSFIGNKPILKSMLKRLDYIYTETTSMKVALEKQGFSNIVLMPNCKDVKILNEHELMDSFDKPLRLCTFSRVMKEKGLDDAVEAISSVNNELEETAFSLDIYGPIDSMQIDWFEGLKTKFTDGIKYCGEVDYNNSVEVLSSYFCLLFPTKFYTEGIPGTIIDSLAAGVPIVSSLWENYSDILDSRTSFAYEFGDEKSLENVLKYIYDNTNLVVEMKKNCLNRAKDYMAYNVIDIICEKLEESVTCKK